MSIDLYLMLNGIQTAFQITNMDDIEVLNRSEMSYIKNLKIMLMSTSRDYSHLFCYLWFSNSGLLFNAVE